MTTPDVLVSKLPSPGLLQATPRSNKPTRYERTTNAAANAELPSTADIDGIYRAAATGEPKPLDRDPAIAYLTADRVDHTRPLLDQDMTTVEPVRPSDL